MRPINPRSAALALVNKAIKFPGLEGYTGVAAYLRGPPRFMSLPASLGSRDTLRGCLLARRAVCIIRLCDSVCTRVRACVWALLIVYVGGARAIHYEARRAPALGEPEDDFIHSRDGYSLGSMQICVFRLA